MTRARGFDAVVVGAGVMGSATARSLARKGARVAVLERFRVPHTRGSSHGRSRIFRFSYHDPLYVRMAVEALPLWRALEADAGEEILRTTGGLDVGKTVDDHIAALQACGARYELIDGAEASRRFPSVSLPPAEPALFQPDAGIALAERAWRAFLAGAVRRGAEVMEEVAVTALDLDGPRPAVRTDGDAYEADVMVVTAGSWAPGILGPAGITLDVRVTRETVAFFRTDGSVPAPTLVDWGDPAVYSLPSPGEGVKAGLHQAGPVVDPDGQGEPDRASVERLAAWVRRRYPSSEPEPHLAQTCLYTNTADDGFILERHGPVVVGSPCSGHGFKFAPLIGDRLADLAAEVL